MYFSNVLPLNDSHFVVLCIIYLKYKVFQLMNWHHYQYRILLIFLKLSNWLEVEFLSDEVSNDEICDFYHTKS